MEIIAIAVSGLAALFTAGSMWYAKGQKDAASRSADEAKRSSDAALEAVAYQRAEVERNRVRFVLEHMSNQAYLIRNEGTDPAYAVHVDVGDLGVHGQQTEFEEWPADHAEKFILARTLDSTTTHVEVTWHYEPDHSDSQQRARLLM